MRQTAPLARVSTPVTTARPLAQVGQIGQIGNVAQTAAHTHKPPAGNQPWFGRDDCHCDDGPERMAKRSVSARW